MKITHNTNGWSPDHTDPEWASRVEREAIAHTARTEAAWRKAERRHARAVMKAEAADANPAIGSTRKARMWQAVGDRLDELRAIEALMTWTPAGSQHRGTPAYRGVGTGRP